MPKNSKGILFEKLLLLLLFTLPLAGFIGWNAGKGKLMSSDSPASIGCFAGYRHVNLASWCLAHFAHYI